MARILLTMPAWNEALIIEKNLRTLHDACSRLLVGHDWIIEVADNGSTDSTPSIVKTLTFELPRVRLLEVNGRGKGMAIRASWAAHQADADILIFLDADLAADIEALPRLVGPVLSGRADLACGSRFMRGAEVERGWFRTLLSKGFRWWQKILLHLPVEDSQCGFKAASSGLVNTVLPHLKEDAFLLDAELIAQAHARGFTVVEVPVAWVENRDQTRKSTVRLWHDIWQFLGGLLRIRRRMPKQEKNNA